jgi:DNA-binding transcriptional LysR family regulator
MAVGEGAEARSGPFHCYPWRCCSSLESDAGSAGSPLPALKNLLHRETLRRPLDELGDGFRLRNVDRVAAFHLDDAGACTLRHGALSRGRDHSIVSCDQVPARLGSPSGLSHPHQQLIDKHLAQAGVKVQIGSIVNLLDTQIALVEAEEGIAIIPSFGMPAYRNRKVVMSQLINPAVRFDFHMISRRGRELPPGADEFTSFLKSYIATWAGRAGVL